MSKPIQVFLCHANEDKDEIIKIYQKLKQNGIKPWMDKELGVKSTFDFC